MSIVLYIAVASIPTRINPKISLTSIEQAIIFFENRKKFITNQSEINEIDKVLDILEQAIYYKANLEKMASSNGELKVELSFESLTDLVKFSQNN